MPRTGYVTLLGLPNAGKSTLLNALVGEKLSIVTAKAQTTWTRVTGIATVDDVQMIFLDTPGLLEAKDLLQQSMLQQALDAVSEADVLLLVVDPQAPLERARVVDALSRSRAQRLVAINKMDVAPRMAVDDAERWAERDLGARIFRISALEGTGVEDLRS